MDRLFNILKLGFSAIAVVPLLVAGAYADSSQFLLPIPQHFPPNKITPVSVDTYRVRVPGGGVHVVNPSARSLASEFCAKMDKTMVLRDASFDMGYGDDITWSCIPPQSISAQALALPPGRIVRVGRDSYELRVLDQSIDAADTKALKLAGEHCARKEKDFILNSLQFDMHYGLVIGWKCVSPPPAPSKH